jgi:LuxR family maltose regulon positive regulatory protein
VISLSQGDPEGARRELAGVVGGTAPVSHRLALIEAHLLDALACRDLGQQRAEYKAVERALNLAESDRLILPFAMTGAWVLLEALPPHETAHAALVAEVLELAGRDRQPAADHPMLVAETLSSTELRVLRYLPTNLTRPEIAGELTISVNTVSTPVRRIYAKLGVTDRNEAVHRARELRLLGPR